MNIKNNKFILFYTVLIFSIQNISPSYAMEEYTEEDEKSSETSFEEKQPT